MKLVLVTLIAALAAAPSALAGEGKKRRPSSPKGHCEFDLRGEKFAKGLQVNTMDDGNGKGVGCGALTVILDGAKGDFSVALKKMDNTGEGCGVGLMKKHSKNATKVTLEAPETDTGPCTYEVKLDDGRKTEIEIDSAGT